MTADLARWLLADNGPIAEANGAAATTPTKSSRASRAALRWPARLADRMGPTVIRLVRIVLAHFGGIGSCPTCNP